jgi:hypothetical protein
MLMSVFHSSHCYPIELFQFLNISFSSSQTYALAIGALIASLILAGLGVLGRFSIFISLLLFLLVIGESIGCARGEDGFYTSWQHCVVVFNLLVLVVAPATESVFSFYRNSKESPKLESWPIELLKFNLVYTYFAGGIVKIKNGLEWMNGYTLQGHLFYYHLEGDLPLAYSLAQNLELMKFISIATVVMELLFPIVLISRRPVGWAFAIITFVMQVIFWYLIDLQWMRYFGWSYLIYLLEILFFLNWRKISSISFENK